MNLDGIFIGIGTFLIIGLLHPVVIKTEYYFGARAWPFFLISGMGSVFLSFFPKNNIMSALLSILGVSLLWGIKEIFEQQKRVEKGWFPKNTKREKLVEETRKSR